MLIDFTDTELLLILTLLELNSSNNPKCKNSQEVVKSIIYKIKNTPQIDVVNLGDCTIKRRFNNIVQDLAQLMLDVGVDIDLVYSTSEDKLKLIDTTTDKLIAEQGLLIDSIQE